MSFDNGMHIVYLLLVLLLVGGGVMVRRMRWREVLRGALGWVVIFIVVLLAVGLWEEIRTPDARTIRMQVEDHSITIPRARDGHFYVALVVNGATVPFLIDTGATQVVLTQKDAAKAGLPMDRLSYTGRANTANGSVRTAPVRLAEVALGPVQDRNLSAWVNEGEMDKSLLGMSYLQRWERMEITRDALILTR